MPSVGYMNSIKALQQRALSDSSKLFVIDFYAPWCGPCKALAPKLEELAEVQLDVCFLKTDAEDELASEMVEAFEIARFPTLVFYKAGKELDRTVGTNIENIKSLIAKYIA